MNYIKTYILVILKTRNTDINRDTNLEHHHRYDNLMIVNINNT